MFLGALPIAIKSTKQVGIYRQSQTWPNVEATITQSFVQKGTDSDGTSYLPEFEFRYTVAGVEYTSNLHTQGTPFPATKENVCQMLNRFLIGNTVQVAVKPTDPSYAILDTGFPKAWNVLRYATLLTSVAGIAIPLAEMVFAK